MPPDQPEYTLRRVWLTPEEEEGYYYGFSNEGLWPLCHIAHTRPLFRASDWASYQEVNRQFADAVVEEMDGTRGAIVLVQDYHFALLPQLIKPARPDARVAVFWHIPWPNPEAFGICPWQNEVLDGLLGADLIGFHTQAHCNNFLETVGPRARVADRLGTLHGAAAQPRDPRAAVPDQRRVCASRRLSARPSADALRVDLLTAFGMSAEFLGVGVDRVDYTKGILERFHGIERFFEKWPHYVGQFTFAQIAAPSRTRIQRYHDLLDEVTAEADRINPRFGTSNWRPIVLLTRHHSHQEIERYYRAADLCLVTSLHDGMNLVAKEFVTAARRRGRRADPEPVRGRVAPTARRADRQPVRHGAGRRRDPPIAEMDPDERRSRMRRMRSNVREHNVYRWAGGLVGDLAEIQLEAPRLRARGQAHAEER